MKTPLNFILCVILFALPSPCFATEARKPNIIFILVDDIGLPGLGCTGGIYKTPNLDSLAAGGTRFEYCFAAPLCAPSRAMLMTGNDHDFSPTTAGTKASPVRATSRCGGFKGSLWEGGHWEPSIALGPL